MVYLEELLIGYFNFSFQDEEKRVSKASIKGDNLKDKNK